MGQLSSLRQGATMHWVCYILLVSSVLQEVFCSDSSESSAEASFSDDENLDEYEFPEKEGIEGSGNSFYDDEDCGQYGCFKSEKEYDITFIRSSE